MNLWRTSSSLLRRAWGGPCVTQCQKAFTPAFQVWLDRVLMHALSFLADSVAADGWKYESRKSFKMVSFSPLLHQFLLLSFVRSAECEHNSPRIRKAPCKWAGAIVVHLRPNHIVLPTLGFKAREFRLRGCLNPINLSPLAGWGSTRSGQDGL